MFNPLTEEQIRWASPLLWEIIKPEWEEDENLEPIVRYVIMVYDPRSPLVINERDLNQRKGLAGDLAHIPEDAAIRECIFNCSYAFISELIIAYMQRFVKTKEWAAICAFEATYWEGIRELILPIEGDNSKQKLESVQKKSAIKEALLTDISRLETLYKSFTGNDDELLKRAKTRLTPEAIAMK